MIRTYIKLALRNIARNKFISALNILGLSVGIAVCLFIGVWVERELTYDNFHTDADRIFRLSNTFKSESESFSQAPCGPALGANLPREMPEMEAACRWTDGSGKISVGDRHFFEQDLIVADSNFFRFFTFPLVSGDPDRALAQPGSIVLSEQLARKLFGNENPVGKTLTYDGSSLLTVSAVAVDPPANSQIRFTGVIPMSHLKQQAAANWGIPDVDQLWLGGWMYTYARLRDAAAWKEAEKHMNEVFVRYAGAEQDSFKMSYTYHLQPIRDVHLQSSLRYDTPSNGSLSRVWVFGSVGLIVLLLAGINYVNLTTAGMVNRARETGVRKVVGAQRRQLMAQYLTESVATVALATLVGLGIFQILLPAFSRLAEQPYSLEPTLRNGLLFAGFILALGGLAGLYPSLVISAFQPARTLKGLFKNSAQGNWMSKALVVFQFTATIALIAGILIIRRQMAYIQEKDQGYNPKAVVEISTWGAAEVSRRYAALRNELLSNPAIESVTLHGGSLVGGLGNGWTFTEDLEGNEISTSAYRLSVQPDFFDTYDMQLAAGRFFSPDIATDTAKAVMVNEAAVRTFGWQKPENALGKRFGTGEDAKYVVGVVKDFNFETLHKPVEALVIHFARGGGRISVKTDLNNAKTAIYHLESVWKKRLPEVPLDYAFVDARVAEQYGNERKMQTLFVIFSSLSLFIACLGLFGLAAMAASNRTKEIGIRKVLGATATGIVGLLSKDFLRLVVISLFIAAPVAWYLMDRWLSDFAYRVSIPWWAFAVAGMMAILIAFLTVGLQAFRAAVSDPVRSLRSE